jgi:hypothetical protein
MKLSERLAKAASERADAAAAGTTVEDWKRQHQSSPSPSARRAVGRPEPAAERSTTVLLAPQTPVTAVDPEPDADPRSVCPTCGRIGELGMVDLHGRTADWSCGACGTMWRVTLPSAPHTAGVEGLPRT